jgi:uncharacterized membrane protein
MNNINDTGYPDNHYDKETGELFEVDPSPPEPESGKNPAPVKSPSFLLALEESIKALPIWITKDAEATVTSKKTGKTHTMKYASLKTVLETVRPVLLSNHIRIRQGADHCWSFDSGQIKGKVVPVYTDLIYSPTGDIDRTVIEIPIANMDAQTMGSAVSYGRRYSLLAALGLATDDEEAEDDGSRTKAKNVFDEHEESQELWGLKSEIDALTDSVKLAAWAERLHASRRAENLPEVEREILRQHFKDARQKLSEATPEKGKK